MKLRLLRYGELESVLRLKQVGLPSVPPAGAFGPLAFQSFSQNIGTQPYTFPEAVGSGLSWTYSLVSAPAGVSLLDRTVTFNTDTLAPQSGTPYTVRATDQFGRFIDAVASFTIVAAAAPDPAEITILSAGPVSGGSLPVNYTIDKDDATVEVVLFSTVEANPTAADFGGANPTYIDQGTASLTVSGDPIILTITGSPAAGSYRMALLPTGGGDANVVVTEPFTL